MELHIPGPKAVFFLLQFAQNATIKIFFFFNKMHYFIVRCDNCSPNLFLLTHNGTSGR